MELYQDVGSGKSGAKLPERDRLMDDARRGKIALVLVWRFDRFARSTRDLLNSLEAFQTWGVDFVSLREGIDTSTPTGKLMFTVIAALAEFERDLIRERVAAGIESARRRGIQLGRPTAAVPVREVRQLLEGGWSVGRVAKKYGVSSRTIRRRLADGGQKPHPPTTTEHPENTEPETINMGGGKT